MGVMFLCLISAVVYGVVGACVFLMLLNRFVILMRDSRVKGPLILALFVSLVGGGFVFGLFFYSKVWLLLAVE